MIEIKPYKINTTEPFFEVEYKGGLAFHFYAEENIHLNNVKLVGKNVKINGDAYLVKELGKVFCGDDGTNRSAYFVLVDKLQKSTFGKGCSISEFEPKVKLRIMKEGETAPEITGEPFQLTETQRYDPKTGKMFPNFEK